MPYRAAVMGAAGYAGAELVRLLIQHPDFELAAITSNADAGCALDSVYPSFTGACDLTFTTHDDPILTTCDVVFLAVPHTAALASAPGLLAAGVTVIDLSADYRLDSAEVYEEWYGVPHTSPELLAIRAFGLPELFSGQLDAARTRHAAGEAVLVACAGCYPTATSLAARPAIDAGLVRDDAVIVVDAVSGVTGAGKGCSARTHFCSADENLEAYGVGSHRHTPEIEQILGAPGRVLFTPHLAPLRRGLLSTVSLPLTRAARSLTTAEVVETYRRAYANHPLVQVLDAGAMPRTASVCGTCVCQIGLSVVGRTGMIVAVGAIDNLCRGAAGQALQCADIVFGLDERRGLPSAGMPV